MSYLSIITVCYNSAKTIRQTFESVIGQDDNDYEYIVIDGGSTDGTVDIIKEYEKKFSEHGIHFSWISEKDDGIYYAMNKGIEMATGEIIGIINSDDFYENGAFMRIHEASISNPEVDVFHGILRYIDNGNVMWLEASGDSVLETRGMIQHPTCFVRKKTYSKFGLYNTEYRYVADYELMLRYKRNGCKFLLVEYILANFRLNGLSSTIAAQVEDAKLKRNYGLIDEKGYRKYIRDVKWNELKKTIKRKIGRV